MYSKKYRTHQYESKKKSMDPIEYLYSFLEQKIKVEIWIINQKHKRITGIIIGFDEWMNLVVE